jgi:hypothetical protein
VKARSRGFASQVNRCETVADLYVCCLLLSFAVLQIPPIRGPGAAPRHTAVLPTAPVGSGIKRDPQGRPSRALRAPHPHPPLARAGEDRRGSDLLAFGHQLASGARLSRRVLAGPLWLA